MNYTRKYIIFFLLILSLSSINRATAQVTESKSSYNVNSIKNKGTLAPNANFTGTVWVNMVVSGNDSLDCAIGKVTFQPGARTHWHYHPGGQILIVTDGVGYYQEKGSPIHVVQTGDVVKCPPYKEHWHGASPDSEFTHTAISTNTSRGSVVWLKPVTDQEYLKKSNL
jgi:quercetin dioxygenase-like cupin family protein